MGEKKNPFYVNLFAGGKFVVGFPDRESMADFMRLCREKGFYWGMGRKGEPSSDPWDSYGSDTYIFFEEERYLLYGSNISIRDYPVYWYSIHRPEPDTETKLAFEFANM